jgi:cell wall-active antibiotic response 4TMS protein YvqF
MYGGPYWAGGWRFGRPYFWPAVLIVLGVYFLLSNLGLLWWLRGDVVWPVLLILFGIALIVGRGRWWRW